MAENAIFPFGTPKEQLDAVNQAIYSILAGGQSDQGRSCRIVWNAEGIAGRNRK